MTSYLVSNSLGELLRKLRSHGTRETRDLETRFCGRTLRAAVVAVASAATYDGRRHHGADAAVVVVGGGRGGDRSPRGAAAIHRPNQRDALALDPGEKRRFKKNRQRSKRTPNATNSSAPIMKKI